MDTIKKTVNMAKNNDLKAKECIKDHYSYIIGYYFAKYKGKISRKELNIMYEIFLNDYYNSEQNIPLILYLHKHFRYVLHDKFDRKQIEVGNTIILACQGDKNARNQLITHFSAVVYEEAKNYDYLEYEDLVQYGIIKLIEHLDNLISLHPNGEFATTVVWRTIRMYFDGTLRKQVLEWNSEFGLGGYEFEDKMSELEFVDFIESYPCVKEHKSIITEYIFDNKTLSQVGNDHGKSHEHVRKLVKEVGKTYQKIR